MSTYSWHSEYYNKALKEMVMTTGKRCEYSFDGNCLGWIEWFEKNYPEQYKKYDDALLKIYQLWGNMDPKAMEEFKSAVKVEVDATKWAIEKYLEFQENQSEEEKLKGTQEALV